MSWLIDLDKVSPKLFRFETKFRRYLDKSDFDMTAENTVNLGGFFHVIIFSVFWLFSVDVEEHSPCQTWHNTYQQRLDFKIFLGGNFLPPMTSRVFLHH